MRQQEEEEQKQIDSAAGPVMPGIEGGSNPEPRRSGFLEVISGFFSSTKEDLTATKRALQEYGGDASKLSAEGADCMARVEAFRELQIDYAKLKRQAQTVVKVLTALIVSHENLGKRLEEDAKSFADKSVVTGLEDGIVNELIYLESPKTGREANDLISSSEVQIKLGKELKAFQDTVGAFSENIATFSDKILVDLEDSVNVYKKQRLLLDDAEKNKSSGNTEALESLRANVAQLKSTVDVKLNFLLEKRYRDLQEHCHLLGEGLRLFVTHCKTISQ